jgi:hypothetical protein
MECVTVAKKKAPAPPPAPNRKPMVAQLRGSEEWKGWIERMAEREGLSVAALFDRMARAYAKEIGFDEPAPKR